MAKNSSSDPVTPASGKSHGLLRELINYLHHLMIVISARLRHTQIERSPMGDAKGDYDIWKRLGKHLEQIPVREKREAKPRMIPKEATREGGRPDSPANYTMPADPMPNELRQHNESKAAHHGQPGISDQLQSKTMEHINIALILAAEGNQAGVKLHIDLANSAMHTASRFMSHEDYAVFEEKVESRLRSIMGGNHHEEPGQDT